MRLHKYLFNFISEISICETQSVIDALILEGIFIKILKPRYNYIPRFDNPDMLDKKMIDLFNQGIFSLSLAIKEGLDIV